MADSAVDTLRPYKGSFIFQRVVRALVFFAVAGVGLSVGLYFGVGPEGVAAGPLLFVAGVGFVYYLAFVAYRKERYEIHSSHLSCKRGSLVSDQTTELDVRNITHVKLRLPWLRYKFFRVGDVLVESAGSSGSEVAFRSIKEPEQVYQRIRVLMQENGYSLKEGELLHESQPDVVGVVVECLGLIATFAFGFAFLAVKAMSTAGGADVAEDPSEAGKVVGLVFEILGVGLTIGGLGAIVVHYLDLRRRSYKVFDDVVVYEEGFLTRENAFIPYENIADGNSKQTFVDQVLGLYDVEVSCQGSGSEIKFRRLRRGKEMSDAISRLVEFARAKPTPSLKGDPKAPDALDLGLPEAREEPGLVAPEEAWTAKLKMNMPRAVVPLLPLFPVVPVWLAATIKAVIQVGATDFSIRPNSVKHTYKFLSASEREFAYDKITGLVIKTNPWDRLFGTITVRLWSIGSPQPIDLLHVRRADVDLEALKRQVGIPPESPQPYALTTAFGVGAWLRARLPGVIALVVLAVALVLLTALAHKAFLIGLVILGVATVVGLVYSSVYFARQRISFHEFHVQAETGVLFKTRYHARYSNVKKLEVVRYPASDLGSVKVFVAGEHRLAQAQQKGGKGAQAGGAVIPYAFAVSYVTGAADQKRLIDDILLGRVRPQPSPTPAEPLALIHEEQPALGNSMFVLILVSTLTGVGLALLPFTIPFCVVAVRRKRYRVEAGRVVSTWGILYKRQASVLFNRVDTLRHGQGMLNKMFGNGEVTLMTAGSSKPDLVLGALPNHEGFYDEIRKHYGKK
jgi:uncharacterized membrane protein YdbT with pleckstrin-like domain